MIPPNKFRPRETFFDLWSDDSAYALGLIFTDGNIYKKVSRRTWVIQFSVTDREVVEWLHAVWGSPCKIYKESNGVYKSRYKTMVSSNYMGERLIELGVIPRKSKVPCCLPKVPVEFRVPFIRGLIDGDGSISLPKSKGSVGGVDLRVSFADAWTEVVQDLSSILTGIGVSSHTYEKGRFKGSNNSVATLVIVGEQAEKLCSILYSDSSFCMTRKRKVWEAYKKIREEMGGLIVEHRKQNRPWFNLLGTYSDSYLSRKFGLDKSKIGKIRRSKGIPVCTKPKQTPSYRPWHELAGKVSDRELASKFSISPATIWSYRSKMGIHPFRPGTNYFGTTA